MNEVTEIKNLYNIVTDPSVTYLINMGILTISAYLINRVFKRALIEARKPNQYTVEAERNIAEANLLLDQLNNPQTSINPSTSPVVFTDKGIKRNPNKLL